jgi:hypothetical protein
LLKNQIPTSIKVTSQAVFSGTGILANGCTSDVPYGMRVSIGYQVMDQEHPAQAISATMVLLENLYNAKLDGQSDPNDPTKYGGKITPSGTTGSKGSYTDQPVGACSASVTSGGLTQDVIVQPRTCTEDNQSCLSDPHIVRTNSMVFTGKTGCGNLNNGGIDISVTKVCP